MSGQRVDVGGDVFAEEFPIVWTIRLDGGLVRVSEGILKHRNGTDDELGWPAFNMEGMAAGGQTPHDLNCPPVSKGFPRIVQPDFCFAGDDEDAPALARVHELYLLLRQQAALSGIHKLTGEIVEHPDLLLPTRED